MYTVEANKLFDTTYSSMGRLRQEMTWLHAVLAVSGGFGITDVMYNTWELVKQGLKTAAR